MVVFIEHFKVPDIARVPFFPLASFQYGGSYAAGGAKAAEMRALLDKHSPAETDCFVQFDRTAEKEKKKTRLGAIPPHIRAQICPLRSHR